MVLILSGSYDPPFTVGGSTSLVPGLGGMQLHSPGTRGVPGLAVHNIQKYPSPRTAGYLYHIVPGLWVVPGLAATDRGRLSKTGNSQKNRSFWR